MYRISNNQRDVLIKAVELLADMDSRGLKPCQQNTIRRGKQVMLKLKAKKPENTQR